MIELIFAIVIIAIVVISLPLMMKTNEDAMEANVVQEALFASSAKIMQVLSYPWDQHSVDSTNPNTYGKVVDIPTGNTAYVRKDANGTTDVASSYRVGHILEDNHRRFHDASLPDANKIGTLTPINSPTALNNIGAINAPFDNPATSATGYKNNYTMDVSVSYIPDNGGSTFIFANTGTSTPSNVKLLAVTIKDSKGIPLTLLRSYSANIGEFDFAKRRF
jgi:hypothetical protein